MRMTAGKPLIISPPAGSWALRDIPGLVKGHLSLYIALTAVAGHALGRNGLSAESLVLGGWVLLLACGAGVLNNIQDRTYDRSMARTRHRILARGDMGAGHALILAAGLILTACAGIWLSTSSRVPLALGGAALLSYNGIYTPMKKKGAGARFAAMIPGTLCGMIPPAIGWASVDRGLAVTDLSGLFLLMAGIGVWQFPHFLLVILKESGDPCGQAVRWSDGEVRAQVVIWSALFSISMMLFQLKGWMVSQVLSALLFVLALMLPLSLALLFWTGKATARRLDLGFWALNFSMLAYMILICLDRA